MEEKRTNWTIWLIVTVIVSLLLSCLISALVGGMMGYFAGKRSALPKEPSIPRIEPFRPHMPERHDVPEIFGGVLVLEVEKGSPADDAGLRPGDIITGLNGQPLNSEPLHQRSFAEIIARYRPGAKITLTVYRGRRERELKVRLEEHPEKGGDVAWLGIAYRQLSPGEMPGGGWWND